MKKNLFIGVMALVIQGAVAQTLTYANFSYVLTNPQSVLVANNSSFNTALNTTTGTGVTWNASGLTPMNGYPVINMGYYNPSTTPYATTYPAANYAQYDPALTSVLDYNYWNISADSASEVGNWSPSTAHEVFQDPDKRLVFPFTYSQMFTDNYAKTNYSNSTTVSSFQTGSRTVTYNGFGTLTLPQGSFSNIALISEVRTNSLGPNSFTYTWFDVSNGKTRMMYHDNAGSISVIYSNEVPNGINSIEKNDFATVYPNPASTFITVKGIDGQQIEKVVINNAQGQVMKSVSGDLQEIDVSRLSRGIYFVSITNSKGIVSVKKCVLTRIE